MIPLIPILAVASVTMVVGMVRFTSALVIPPARRTARWTWGIVYLGSWAAIVGVIWRLLQVSDDEAPPMAVVVLVPAAWGTFNAFWVWFAIALSQTASPDAGLLARRAGRLAAAGVVLVLASVWWLGAPQLLIATMTRPGNRAASAAIAVAVLGWAALVFGGARLAMGVGHEMSRAEIEELERRNKFEPRGSAGTSVRRWSAYRIDGHAKGVQGSATFTIGELRGAWRMGLWRRDPMWRVVFMMTFGAIAMIAGGVTAAFLLGSGSTRVVLGALVVYGMIQAGRGIRQGLRNRKQAGADRR